MSDSNSELPLAESAPPSSIQKTTPSQLVAALQSEHPEWITQITEALGEVTALVPREQIVALCSYLKTAPDANFDFLADLCGVDRGVEEEPRFEVNYHLFSTTKFHRLRLKVLVNEDDARVPTVTGVWRTANWHERETFDLMGVVFEGHPDLRRILLDPDWVGHPLLKSYAVDTPHPPYR